ncbi:MAG: glycosyltransferase [Verrucomicrobiaceae bacterium]|nr:glycosyltransferase [Verrucomicrobiaceae bacterium]
MSETSWRILWVKAGALHPADTGGKIRTLSMLRELNRWHHVTFLSPHPAGSAHHPDEMPDGYANDKIWIERHEPARMSAAFFMQLALNLFSSQPFALSKHFVGELKERLMALDASGEFDLIVCDFLAPALHFEGHQWRTPTVLFQHNMESQIWKRMAANHPRWWGRMFLQSQFRRMYRCEENLSRLFKGIITVSAEDSKFAREQYHLTNVLGDVPPGVDTEFFRPTDRLAESQPVLAFLGSMDWMPNIEGVHWFVREVYPQVRAAMPGVRLRIVGRKPGADIRALAQHDPTIEVTGTVEDVRPCLADAAALIVPLLSGGGTRIKILEAMAFGLPVLSTTIGAEGLPFDHDRHLLLADSSADFATQCVHMLRDRSLRDRLAQAARDEVVNHYSWAAASRKFEALCRVIVEKRLA